MEPQKLSFNMMHHMQHQMQLTTQANQQKSPYVEIQPLPMIQQLSDIQQQQVFVQIQNQQTENLLKRPMITIEDDPIPITKKIKKQFKLNYLVNRTGQRIDVDFDLPYYASTVARKIKDNKLNIRINFFEKEMNPSFRAPDKQEVWEDTVVIIPDFGCKIGLHSAMYRHGNHVMISLYEEKYYETWQTCY